MTVPALFVCVLQTVIATLQRDSAGLGFSVAGGKGTMPYRVDDEVSASSTLVIIFACHVRKNGSSGSSNPYSLPVVN